MRPFSPLFALLLPAAMHVSACSEETASYAPYEGTAFPNRRPRFEKDGRLLGYVTNRMSDTVSVIDLDAMTELGRAPVGIDPVEVDGPRRITLDEASGLAYVSLSYLLSVVSAHNETDAVVTQRLGYVIALDLNDLGHVGERSLEPKTHDIAFSPQTGQLFVTHYDTYRSVKETELEARRASLDFIAPASGMRDQSAALEKLNLCIASTAIALKQDGTRAFVACTGEDAVGVVDTQTKQVLSRVPAGSDNTNKPIALAANPRDQILAVSNQVARTLTFHSMADQPTLLTSHYFMGWPGQPAWLSDTTLIVPTQDGQNGTTLLEVGGAGETSATVVRETLYDLAQCEHPTEAVKSRDGRVFVVCEGNQYDDGAIVRIDPTTLAILARVQVGHYPDHLALRE